MLAACHDLLTHVSVVFILISPSIVLSLDLLERQEEALKVRLRARVLPELATDPLGVAGDDKRKLAPVDPKTIDPTAKPAAVPFWQKYQSVYEELQRDRTISQLEDDSMEREQQQKEHHRPRHSLGSTGSAMSIEDSL